MTKKQIKALAQPVVFYRDLRSIQNGSFHRVWPDGRIIQYMNGDNMGPVDKVPKNCVEQLPQSEANNYLPECNRID